MTNGYGDLYMKPTSLNCYFHVVAYHDTSWKILMVIETLWRIMNPYGKILKDLVNNHEKSWFAPLLFREVVQSFFLFHCGSSPESSMITPCKTEGMGWKKTINITAIIAAAPSQWCANPNPHSDLNLYSRFFELDSDSDSDLKTWIGIWIREKMRWIRVRILIRIRTSGYRSKPH